MPRIGINHPGGTIKLLRPVRSSCYALWLLIFEPHLIARYPIPIRPIAVFYSLPTLAHKTTPHATKTITACCRAISIRESEAAHCSEALHMSVAGSASEEPSLLHLLTDYAVNWICRYVRGVKATAEVSDKIFWRMLIGSVVHCTRRFWRGLEAMICDGLV